MMCAECRLPIDNFVMIEMFSIWLQMAEALMLEMDGDSDGSITEEELVVTFSSKK